MDVPPPRREWWRDFPQAIHPHPLNLCFYCGHVRALHEITGCTSLSLNIMSKRPCECTNTNKGQLYRSPVSAA